MARTRDPNDEIAAFQAEADASLDLWRHTQDALQTSDLKVRKATSLDAFLRAAVAWEGFRSRWHIAAINRDSSEYRRSTSERLRQHLRGNEKWATLEPYVSLSLPRRLSIPDVARLLDPRGSNISFGDNWVDRARDQLADPYRTKVTALPSDDLKVVQACEKLRNALVHRSSRAVVELNDALAALVPQVDADLVRTTKTVRADGVAAYLHAMTSSGRRVEVWHRRLRQIAGKLRT